MHLITILVLAFTMAWVSPSYSESIFFEQEDECNVKTSCASCIKKSQCAWCLNKSKCTKQSCGNDIVIYPLHVYALMSGPQFCPRVVQPEGVLTLESGKNETITVPLTQIHLSMSYTPWKCRIQVGEIESTVPATLVSANVLCSPVLVESNEPYSNGSVAVMWDNNKNFDGAFQFKVCRCDLDMACDVCKDGDHNENERIMSKNN